MRALRVVGLTEDGDVVLEDPVRLERYTVPADERLRAAARGDLSRLGQIAIELESQLRPREIQARIRAGASVEQVATAAGVPEQKIERFAYPVLPERFRTADNAQRAHPMRADGPDNRTLAEVIAHTFGLRGQDIRRREVGLVEGRGRPLGGRAELAGGAVGQPCALGVPAGRARRHRDRARRARERPGRGPAGPAAAHRRCRGRHDPSGGGAAARSLAGGAVAGGGVRQLPRPHTDAHGRRTAHARRAVATRAACAAAGRAAGRSPAGGAPARRSSGPRSVRPSSAPGSSDRRSRRRPPTGRRTPPRGRRGQREPRACGVGPVGAGGQPHRRAPAADASGDRRPCAGRRRRGARGPDRRPGEPGREKPATRATATPADARDDHSPRRRIGRQRRGSAGPCHDCRAGRAADGRGASVEPSRPNPRRQPDPAAGRTPPTRHRSTAPGRSRLRPSRPNPRRDPRQPETAAPALCADRRWSRRRPTRRPPSRPPTGARPPPRRVTDGRGARGGSGARARGTRRDQAHAQGQAGHAVVGRGAPGGPRAPLSPALLSRAGPAASRPTPRAAPPPRPAPATARTAPPAPSTATGAVPVVTSRFAGIHSSPNAPANAPASTTSAIADEHGEERRHREARCPRGSAPAARGPAPAARGPRRGSTPPRPRRGRRTPPAAPGRRQPAGRAAGRGG